jgi:N-acetylglucosamine-6-phosphate deacetylase
VALSRPDVVVQAIVDHVHLAPEVARLAWLAARGRFALVTDAVEAAGLPEGRHRLGDREVDVVDGEVRLADGTLAGSVLTLDEAVRNLVGLGAPVDEALAAASTIPARLLGRDDVGTLAPGAVADVVVLGDALAPLRTLVGGNEVFSGSG